MLDNPGLQALIAYRLGQSLLRANKRIFLFPLLLLGWPLYFLASRYVWIALDIRLRLSAKIGDGLYIGHFGNIRVERCIIGNDCSIAQSVHILPGAAPDGPVIGDRVWIGAHSHIVGALRIGSDSTIGAGGHVLKDIPEHALCLGNPTRVISRFYDNRDILRIQA
jgi:serine O-acetyltransferase